MAVAAYQIKKRKADSGPKARLPGKKFKKQRRYSSGSEDDSKGREGFVARDAPRTETSKHTSLKPALKSSKEKPEPASTERSLLEASSASGSDSDADSTAGLEKDYGSKVTNEGNEGDSDEEEAISDSASDEVLEDGSAPTQRKKTKRHDPSAFANSLSTILNSKLPTSKRADPILSRSRDAQTAAHELAESKLEAKAKRKMRDEKRLATDKGRVKDVLLGDRNDQATATSIEQVMDGSETMSAADIAEQERRLRKTAQRGVVKLFNAVRAAQVKGEEAARLAREQGIVGDQKRKEKVGEMGRNAFLEMVGAGAKTES
ncbi:MAG: hypothetical protein MMC23_006061 [Stictis urceolatum]|nr:hypothetical protein [Stictis urceolata]